MTSRRRYFRTARPDPVPTVPDDGQPLLTLDEARAYLNLASVRAVYRLVGKGMPTRKVGGRLRFHRGELDAWTRRQRPVDASLLSSADAIRLVR